MVFRLLAPLAVMAGLAMYAGAVMGAFGSGDPSLAYLGAIGAGIALGGLWLAGLDRLVPGTTLEEGLFGGILAGIGVLPLMAALPPVVPDLAPASRVAFALAGLPVLVAGIAFAGALQRATRALVGRGLTTSWLLGALTIGSWALALLALAWLAAAHPDGVPLAFMAAGLTGLVACSLAVRLTFPIEGPWRPVHERAFWATVVSAPAAGVTANALLASRDALPGAVVFLIVAGAGWWGFIRALRLVLQPPPPEPPTPPVPPEEPDPVGPVGPRSDD